MRVTRNSAACGRVWSASAVMTAPARSSPSSSGWNTGTSSGAPPTWRWASTVRLAWSIQASRCTGRPSAARAPRSVLPSTATARPPPAATVPVPGGQPGADGAGQHVGVQARKRPADGGLGRDAAVARSLLAGAERGPDRLGRVGAHSAIVAIDRAPASTAAAARPRMATSGWRRPRAARGSGTLARKASRCGGSLSWRSWAWASWVRAAGIGMMGRQARASVRVMGLW
jgi:hypothetical protein